MELSTTFYRRWSRSVPPLTEFAGYLPLIVVPRCKFVGADIVKGRRHLEPGIPGPEIRPEKVVERLLSPRLLSESGVPK